MDYERVFKTLTKLVDNGWDFLKTCDETGVDIDTVWEWITNERILKNTYFSLTTPQDRRAFKAIWDMCQFDGYVYFVHAKGTGRVKIGYSTDPFRRLKDLQTGSSVELEIVQMIQGNTKVEKLLHDKFKHLNVNREWFEYKGELKQYVENIAKAA